MAIWTARLRSVPLIKPDEIILHAGAGVVADSKPELEHLEVHNKLKALFASLDELAGS